MKFKLIVLCILLAACNGSLTDEQRKKAKLDIARNQIRKISDSQITEAAFTYGRAVDQSLTKNSSNVAYRDSLEQASHVKIVFLRIGDAHLSEKEQSILDAYAAITNKADFSDNIQKLNADSILYTKPFLKESPGGSLVFDYALGVRIPKKEIVLSIKN